MAFKMKYPIKKDYIQKGKRRPGTYIKPYFGVLHDTGNEGSTAQNNRNYYNNTPNDPTAASAHTFIDDQQILEVVPTTLDKTERAHHVRYDVTVDNHLFGDDANDIAIGVELCWGGKINFNESYKRYVWYCAYVSYKFGFPPTRWIGHEKLDVGRKTDPTNALKRFGKTYAQLLKDIVDEYNECSKSDSKPSIPNDGVLGIGDKNVSVKQLQTNLNKLGYNCGTPDGIFGKMTDAAVRTFQKDNDLVADGIVGAATLKKIDEKINIKPVAEKAEIIEEVKQIMRDINVVSEWAKKDWEEAKVNGYFDGKRPGATITREESAVVTNRIRNNFKGLMENLDQRIAKLETLVQELNK